MISGMGASILGGGGGRRKGPVDLAKEYCGTVDGRVADPEMRGQVAQLRMDQLSFNASLRRSAEETKAGMGPGAASSMFKLYGTELNKRRYETLVAIRGAQGLGWEGDGFSDTELAETREWLRSKGNSIEGGTSEIQLNVIAKRVLGLPD